VKIKIIVAEVANSAFKKNFRKWVSPVLSKFDMLPEFGMFHSALVIGPWLIVSVIYKVDYLKGME
jgi:hypothetical protein